MNTKQLEKENLMLDIENAITTRNRISALLRELENAPTVRLHSGMSELEFIGADALDVSNFLKIKRSALEMELHNLFKKANGGN